MGIEAIRREYENRKEKYKKLADEIIFTLEKEISKEGIPYHQITGRVKTFDSFMDKANRLESKEPFEDIVDICGVRVICLFLSDLQRIGKTVERCFEIQERDDKIYTEPDAFGYLSVHYIGNIPESFTGPRYDEIKGLKFEIQLRTIAMHAWATISHYLDYKSQLAIPSHLRKDFNALSAMFYVADEHFEMFFKSSEEAKQIAEEKASTPQLEMEEINYNTLEAYLLAKYKDREHGNPEIMSILIEELQKSGYRTIKQLDEVLKRSEKAFKANEKDNPPGGEKGRRFIDVGVVRVSLCIADENYLRNFDIPESSKEKRRQYRHMVE